MDGNIVKQRCIHELQSRLLVLTSEESTSEMKDQLIRDISLLYSIIFDELSDDDREYVEDLIQHNGIGDDFI